jgi:glucuronate isomerase
MFIKENFLLQGQTAQKLYHDFASSMPIIDYHNHLPPNQIAQDKQFESITQVWLNGDHYKWRALRALGVNENYITGSASDYEKFEKWATAVPYTLRNPLYHWTHLELKNYFGVNEVLSHSNSLSVFDTCNGQLQNKSHSVRGLLNQMNVKMVCTTDDPIDSLEHHISYAKEKQSLQLLPSYRPDKFILIDGINFLPSVDKLSILTGIVINDYDSLFSALSKRADFFQQVGCKVSDHGLEYISSVPYTDEEVDGFVKKALNQKALLPIEIEKYKSKILIDLGKMYHKLGWIQQFHLGAQRNNNLRALREMGPDTGWDSIGDFSQARNLSNLLGQLDEFNMLTKTVIYNLNPSFNEVMATMIGNFNDGSIKGKIQFGSGWWFLDQKDGMEKQLNALSNMGVLSTFIGMLTDSRSFLSFPRHEYFRRILCNIFGNEIDKGEIPNDINWVGKIIQDICFNNVAEYLNYKES